MVCVCEGVWSSGDSFVEWVLLPFCGLGGQAEIARLVRQALYLLSLLGYPKTRSWFYISNRANAEMQRCILDLGREKLMGMLGVGGWEAP